jgi:hypothetical protein
VADQSEANGNNRRPEHAAGDPLQHFCEGDRREAGPKAEDQDAQGYGQYSGPDQRSFRSHSIHKLTAWHLTKQTGGAANAQDKSDVLGGPPLGRQVGGGNRSKGGLHTGQKEVEPAQGKQTLLRRRSRFPQGPRLNDTHLWDYLSPDSRERHQPRRSFSTGLQ